MYKMEMQWVSSRGYNLAFGKPWSTSVAAAAVRTTALRSFTFVAEVNSRELEGHMTLGDMTH